MFNVALINTTDPNFVPKRADTGSAGYDVLSRVDLNISPGHRALIPTGFAIEIPSDHYGRIAPRSGLANKNGLDVLGGVIDSSYRGEVHVILINHGESTHKITKGDRIAQLIFERISTPELTLVTYDTLTTTDRGANGFGSTGI
jgi:dUTP pyrophosphatase